MSLWKKAGSIVASAALLSSLFVTAASAATVTVTTQGTLYPWTATASDTSLPADGLSSFNITFCDGIATIGGCTGKDQQSVNHVTALKISVTGAYFLSGTGSFQFVNGASGTNVTFPVTSFLFSSGSNFQLLDNSTIQLASSTAGSALFTVQYSDTVLGTNFDSSYSFTFKGATSTTISTSYSLTKVKDAGDNTVKSTSAGSGLDTLLHLKTTVADTNNSSILSGAKVTWTISGFGYFESNGAAVESNSTSTTGTFTSSHIISTGVAGVATISTTVTYLGTTYKLADVTLAFTGQVAKVTVANNYYSLDVNGENQFAPNTVEGDGTGNQALEVAVLDAAGNPVADFGSDLTFATGTYTPANIFTVDTASAVWDSTDKAYDIDVNCVDTGTATVTIKASTVDSDGTTTTVESPAATFTCADPLASDAVGSLAVDTSGGTSVAPNGQLTLKVNVKDDNGLPAVDGSTTATHGYTVVTAVTNGIGSIVSSKGGNTAATSNGSATFYYLAPATAGTATVTFFVPNTTQKFVTVTINVGGAAPSGGITWAPTGSALGNTLVGPFSVSTKIQSVGGYITWKVDGGAAVAGQTLQVWVYKKYSATGAWAGPTMLTTRKANASGVAYINIHTNGILWLSLRPVLPATATTAASWGPTSIGRWR